MRELIANNAEQLDLCLKVLYSENIPFTVKVKEDDELRIIYGVEFDVNDPTYEKLNRRYSMYIS